MYVYIVLSPNPMPQKCSLRIGSGDETNIGVYVYTLLCVYFICNVVYICEFIKLHRHYNSEQKTTQAQDTWMPCIALKCVLQVYICVYVTSHSLVIYIYLSSPCNHQTNFFLPSDLQQRIIQHYNLQWPE